MDSSTTKFNNVTIKSVLLIGQSNMAGRGDFGRRYFAAYKTIAASCHRGKMLK